MARSILKRDRCASNRALSSRRAWLLLRSLAALRGNRIADADAPSRRWRAIPSRARCGRADARRCRAARRRVPSARGRAASRCSSIARPYGKHHAAESYQTHLKAVARGYAVVLQDVRGRYASDGRFDPYRQEGADGYDTIEWAASQPWSNGVVGTFGLSYPGAVQWLAAMEAPPHLAAMVPAMTFSSPRNFFYANGVFDLLLAALDLRQHRAGHPHNDSTCPALATRPRRPRPGRPSPTSTGRGCRCEICPGCAAKRRSISSGLRIRRRIPGGTGRSYAVATRRVTAAVLNLSGWYDEGYGPEGAATNFNGLVQARAGDRHAADAPAPRPVDPRRGIHRRATKSESSTSDRRPRSTTTRSFSISSIITCAAYDNDYADGPAVRHFVMGANEWQTALELAAGGRAGPCRSTSTVPTTAGALLRFDGACAGSRRRRPSSPTRAIRSWIRTASTARTTTGSSRRARMCSPSTPSRWRRICRCPAPITRRDPCVLRLPRFRSVGPAAGRVSRRPRHEPDEPRQRRDSRQLSRRRRGPAAPRAGQGRTSCACRRS